MQSRKETPRVLLVHMPMADPGYPNLAIEQLAQLVRQAGGVCDVHYGTLQMAKNWPRKLIHSQVAPILYTPSYFDLPVPQVAENLMVEIEQALPADFELPADQREAQTFEFEIMMDEAAATIEAALAMIPRGRYDIIGFSVIFDVQKIPSIALAKRLKQREPNLKVLFGGTGCDRPMGRAMLEVFPEIDAVMQGDGDQDLLPTLDFLCGYGTAKDIENLVYRQGPNIVENGGAGFADEITPTPMPDYNNFLSQLKNSPFSAAKKTLFYEGSRGCWWGWKNHCRFCGIRAVRYPYRSVKSENLVHRVEELWDRYKPDAIYATDAILDFKHLREAMPLLAKQRQKTGRKGNLFFETKSNLKRQELALLAAAGVVSIQPGIESFSNETLLSMSKGTTGLQQVQLLKWAGAYGVEVIYALLLGVPGETASGLSAMCELMKTLHHLPPPLQTNRLQMHRYSPYFETPEQYGFHNVRPNNIQRMIYQCDDDLLTDLIYEFDYSHPEQDSTEMVAAREMVRLELEAWQKRYDRGYRLKSIVLGDSRMVTGIEDGAAHYNRLLTGLELDVLRLCDQITSVHHIQTHTGQPMERIEAVVASLLEDGLLVKSEKQLLSLVVVDPVDCFADAHLPPLTSSLPLELAGGKDV